MTIPRDKLHFSWFQPIIIILGLLTMFLSLTKCKRVVVVSDAIASDGNTVVSYSKECPCPNPVEALRELAKKANAGEFDWTLMKDSSFRASKLNEQCAISLLRRLEQGEI
jgi:hypothetical protein